MREIGLPDYDVGRLGVGTGEVEPDQNAVIIRVCDGQNLSVGSYTGGVSHSRWREGRVRTDEIGLTEHKACHAAADSAGASIRGVLSGTGVSVRVAESQDAIVVGYGAEAIGIVHPEHPIRVGDAAGRAEQLIRSTVVIGRPVYLTNQETRRLAGGEYGGLSLARRARGGEPGRQEKGAESFHLV